MNYWTKKISDQEFQVYSRCHLALRFTKMSEEMPDFKSAILNYMPKKNAWELKTNNLLPNQTLTIWGLKM